MLQLKGSAKGRRWTLLSAAVLCFALATLSPTNAVLAQTTDSASSQSLVQITCTLRSANGTIMNATPGQFSTGNFPPGGSPPPGAIIIGPGNASLGGPFGFSQTGPGPGGLGSMPFAFSMNLMNQSQYSDISSVANVAAVVPVLRVPGGPTVTSQPSNSDSSFSPAESCLITGVALEAAAAASYSILPSNITSGRSLQSGDSGVVLLGQTAAENLGAGVSDTVTLLGKAFQVIGIFESALPTGSNAAYMSLSDAQTLTNNTGQVSSIEVFTASENAEAVTNAIKARHPELGVFANRQGSGSTSYATLPGSSASPSPTASSEMTAGQSSNVDFTGVFVAVAVIAVAVLVGVIVLLKKRANRQDEGPLEAPSGPFS
ncbi:MAG: ABC transporter permease [Candidatus Bathyarchaeia archaeon]